MRLRLLLDLNDLNSVCHFLDLMGYVLVRVLMYVVVSFAQVLFGDRRWVAEATICSPTLVDLVSVCRLVL